MISILLTEGSGIKPETVQRHRFPDRKISGKLENFDGKYWARAVFLPSLLDDRVASATGQRAAMTLALIGDPSSRSATK